MVIVTVDKTLFLPELPWGGACGARGRVEGATNAAPSHDFCRPY
jgi:hypothetical protein